MKSERALKFEIISDNYFDFGWETGIAFGEYVAGKRVWASAVRFKNGSHADAIKALRQLADQIEAHYESR